MPRSRVVARLQTLLWLAASIAQATQMCGMQNHRSNRLYFAAGNYTFNDGAPAHKTSELYSLDLTKQIDVSGLIDMDLIQQSDLPKDTKEDGGQSSVEGDSGVFFYDHTTLYAYGGAVTSGADGSGDQMWTYNTTSPGWTLETVEGGPLVFGQDTNGQQASDPASSLAFYTGGTAVSNNDTRNGIIRFNSSDSTALQWSFDTAVKGMQGPDIYMGSMVYVRMGRAGVLLAFGGYNTTYPGNEFVNWQWDQAPLRDIFVYDIDSYTWYLVEATGAVPSNRSEFCAGVSAAPDDSSFQITMFGGWDLAASQSFNDVFVLSIPSFQWISVQATNSTDHDAARHRHKCDMWQDGQMIVSGGMEGGTACNTSFPPLKVLDTSTYSWSPQFQPELNYTVPQVITNVIGGDGSGGASVKEPLNGWSNSDLQAIFSQTVPRDNYVPPGGGSGSPGTSPTAAIAGGVVGGMVGLALVAFAVWFFFRRHRRRQREVQRGIGYDQRISSMVQQHGPLSIGPLTATELQAQNSRRELPGRSLSHNAELNPDPRSPGNGASPGRINVIYT